MIAPAMLAAVCADGLLGEPRRMHPLVLFGRYAQRIEKRLHSASAGAMAQRCRGVLAVVLAVAPWTLLVWILAKLPYFGAAFSVLVLYFTLGHRSLREHALNVYRALQDDRLDLARDRVGLIVSRDVVDMDARRIAAAAVESVLENGSDAVFGALFWFALAGAPGALLYRLANTLDAMWGYRTPRYLHFGWAAARLDDLLNLVPARLTALSYAVIGRTRPALRCWHAQAAAWESPNAGSIMASGAGALELQLGGGAFYHGTWKQRPELGTGALPDAQAIVRALRLVLRTLLLWLLVIAGLEMSFHA